MTAERRTHQELRGYRLEIDVVGEVAMRCTCCRTMVPGRPQTVIDTLLMAQEHTAVCVSRQVVAA